LDCSGDLDLGQMEEDFSSFVCPFFAVGSILHHQRYYKTLKNHQIWLKKVWQRI